MSDKFDEHVAAFGARIKKIERAHVQSIDDSQIQGVRRRACEISRFVLLALLQAIYDFDDFLTAEREALIAAYFERAVKALSSTSDEFYCHVSDRAKQSAILLMLRKSAASLEAVEASSGCEQVRHSLRSQCEALCALSNDYMKASLAPETNVVRRPTRRFFERSVAALSEVDDEILREVSAMSEEVHRLFPERRAA